MVLTKKVFKFIDNFRMKSLIRVRKPIIKKTFYSVNFTVLREVGMIINNTSREGGFIIMLKDKFTIVTNDGNVKNVDGIISLFFTSKLE